MEVEASLVFLQSANFMDIPAVAKVKPYAEANTLKAWETHVL